MADFTDEKTNKKSEALRDSVSGLQVPVPGERILSPSYLSLLQCVHLKKRTCMLPAAHTQLGLALVLAMSFLPPDLPSALATCLCPGLTWKDHIDGQPWQVTGRDGAGQRTANRLLPCKRGRVRVLFAFFILIHWVFKKSQERGEEMHLLAGISLGMFMFVWKAK